MLLAGALGLRTAATKLPTLEVDVGDDGSADFQIALSRFDRIRVFAGDGADTVRVGNVALPVTIDGQGGDDSLVGGNGAETLSGGEGTDTVQGGHGDDMIDLGDGNDSSVRVDGGDGFDTLTFNGSGADERLGLTADGARARLTRDVGPVAIDTGTVERLDVEPLGGNDTLTLDDLTGTAVQELRADLEAVKNGNAPDTGTDKLILNGTVKDDLASILGSGGSTFVLGLPTFVSIQRFDPARDELTVNALAGNDRIEAGGASNTKLVADGGAGDDTLTGSDDADVLIGGDGRDFIDSRHGADVVLLGAGDDTFNWRASDGSDRVEGQTGTDALTMSGSSAGETFEASSAGARLRASRSNANGAEVLDTGGIEALSTLSFGGADTLVVNDVTGSDLKNVDANLFDFGVPGGASDEPRTRSRPPATRAASTSPAAPHGSA
jgi:Ca2+-binding RTX toxin-like protein